MARAPELVAGRRRLRVTGVVQGVGFRPFVHRIAERHGLGGFVSNDGGDVVVEVEGPADALDAFASALADEAPPLARVGGVACEPAAPRGARRFTILPSAGGAGAGLVPPDVRTCDACLAELRDPGDRRHRHPFISCTDCGPRLTIARSAPFDRARTTMAGFPMCAACAREYADPADRRFHAQTICCHDCGPRLSMPLGEAVSLLGAGAIVAVKGLGGYHLACDASDEDAVARLRARKGREAKPLAVMSAAPAELVDMTGEEEALLASAAAPIVLMRRRERAAVAASVAPGSPWLGVMTPYTPLHHLLLDDLRRALVMTSGNRSDEPIAFDDADAMARLADVADAVLAGDRPIHRRCEDSVVRAGFPVRRSRGMAPGAIPLPVAARRPVVAVGGELKAVFCVARGHAAHPSAHLGDMHTEEAYAAFRADLALWLRMLGVGVEVVACDLHPGYLSTGWAHAAADAGAELVEVQHHHAHAAACLAEHGERGLALACVFDGTGLGDDGTLWGGEVLRCDLASCERVAHLRPVPLPGGEAAVREPWRMAAAYLEAAGRPVPFPRWPAVRQSLRVNAPRSSAVGRLFDAAAALLGVRERVAYEAQAAIELEALAGDVAAGPYPCRAEGREIIAADLIAAAHDDLAAGRPRAEIAAAVHEGVAAAAARACVAAGGSRTVALSGGAFQNLRLLASTRRRLEAEGFRVLVHRRVPPNDGGLAYGQAAVAAGRMAACA